MAVRRPHRRTVGVLCVALLLPAILAAAASASPPVRVLSRAVNPEPAKARAYWTPQRLRGATPLRLAIDPSSGKPRILRQAPQRDAFTLFAQGTDTGDPSVFPSRANGKVFFSVGPDDFSCSGSVVDTPARRTVLTAAHCVVAPDSGAESKNLIFVPGYRDGAEPFGEWAATKLEAPQRWAESVDASSPDEAVDVGAFQVAPNGAGQQIQSLLGALGIGFNQPRDQTYTEYGYPAEFPYDGSRLYSVSSPHTGDDPSFSPPTIEIQSDFTAGASGGPFVAGPGPTTLSVDTYGYLYDPFHNYGPYFGDAVKSFYDAVAGIFEFRGVRRNKHTGTAKLSLGIPASGSIALSGTGVKSRQQQVNAAGTVRLPVSSRGAKKRRLRSRGRVEVKVEVTYMSNVGTPNTESKRIKLVKRGQP